jgi:hypothetical protein
LNHEADKLAKDTLTIDQALLKDPDPVFRDKFGIRRVSDELLE